MANEITLESLVGEHALSGVDFETARVPVWTGSDMFEDAQTCRFCLDGITYVAIENPDDGYRSSLRSIGITGDTVRNSWPPVRVLASMRTRGRYSGSSEVLELRDVVTGKIVLSVGTEDVDDYYPGFVAEFSPENLAHNRSRKPGRRSSLLPEWSGGEAPLTSGLCFLVWGRAGQRWSRTGRRRRSRERRPPSREVKGDDRDLGRVRESGGHQRERAEGGAPLHEAPPAPAPERP